MTQEQITKVIKETINPPETMKSEVMDLLKSWNTNKEFQRFLGQTFKCAVDVNDPISAASIFANAFAIVGYYLGRASITEGAPNA